MKLTFTSTQIKGKGRGVLLGYPTINCVIPKNFSLLFGIYAAFISIHSNKYMGALHYGPIPTFSENQKSLEIFVIDADPSIFTDNPLTNITITVVKKIRDIRTFRSSEDLSTQIGNDVLYIRKHLKSSDCSNTLRVI